MFYTVTSETSAAQTNNGNAVKNVPAAVEGKAEGNTNRPSFGSVFGESEPYPSDAGAPRQKEEIELPSEDSDARTNASGEVVQPDSVEGDAPVEDEHPIAMKAAEGAPLVAGQSEAEIEEQNAAPLDDHIIDEAPSADVLADTGFEPDAALKHGAFHQDRKLLTESVPPKPAIVSDEKGEASWAGNAQDDKVEGRNAQPQAMQKALTEPSQNPARSPDGFDADRALAEKKVLSDPADRPSSAAPSHGSAKAINASVSGFEANFRPSVEALGHQTPTAQLPTGKNAEFLATAGESSQVGNVTPSSDGELRGDAALKQKSAGIPRPENYTLAPQPDERTPNQAVLTSPGQARYGGTPVSKQERDTRSVPNVRDRVGADVLSQLVTPGGGVAAPPTQSIMKSAPAVDMGRGMSSAVPAPDTSALQIAVSKRGGDVQQVPSLEPADYRRMSMPEARTAPQGTSQPDSASFYVSKPVSSPAIVTSAVVSQNLDAHSKGEDRARTSEPDSGRMTTIGALTSQVETSAPLRTSVAGLPRMPDLPRHVSEHLAAGLRQASEQSAEIRLNPAELGRVRISLHTSDTGVTVSVLAERPKTLDLLRRNSDILAQEFREIGYGAAEFSFGQGGDPQTGQESDADRGSYRHDVAKSDGDAMPAVAPLHASTRIALDRVDIRL